MHDSSTTTPVPASRPALEQALLANLDRLRAYVRLRCGARLRALEAVSDLVQSACREMLREFDAGEFRGEAPFRAWLFRTARRKIVDRVRYHGELRRDAGRRVALHDQAIRTSIAAAYSSAQLLAPGDALLEQEMSVQLEAAMARLSPADREVILLLRVAGLSHSEAARQLGLQPGAMRTRLSRALARLAELLPDGPGQRGAAANTTAV
jgi:RNA polymerase sigma factor (sigma-70 family)